MNKYNSPHFLTKYLYGNIRCQIKVKQTQTSAEHVGNISCDFDVCVFLVGRACPCVRHAFRLGTEGSDNSCGAGATREVRRARVRSASMEGIRSQNISPEKLIPHPAGGMQILMHTERHAEPLTHLLI